MALLTMKAIVMMVAKIMSLAMVVVMMTTAAHPGCVLTLCFFLSGQWGCWGREPSQPS